MIKFGPPGAGLDFFSSHGRVTIVGPTLDVGASPVGWLISNAAGKVYSVELPAGVFVANQKRTGWTYKNKSAKTLGGVYSATVRITRHQTSYGYRILAYGDLSKATDPLMNLQFYVGAEPTPGIHGESWQRTKSGWRAHGFE